MKGKKAISPGKAKAHAFGSSLLQYAYSKPEFVEYTNGDNRISTFKEEVRERKYSVGETNVSYRNLDHWEAKGLLPDGAAMQGRGWRRFNLIEIVWLETLSRLRNFGVSIDKISRIKEAVFEWNANLETYLLFEYYVAKAIVQTEDPYVAVGADGSAVLLVSSEIEALKADGTTYDILLISLKSILSDLGIEVERAQPLFCLTEAEADALKLSRFRETEAYSNKKVEFAEAFSKFDDSITEHLDLVVRKLGK